MPALKHDDMSDWRSLICVVTDCAARIQPRTSAAGEPSPGEARVRAELQRILESPEFQSSGRSQQFLRHVVDCALRGEEQSLKETTIGSVLLGRDPGYDTGNDPAVRVRASDVRKRLLAYYKRVGGKAHVRIALSPGSYVPQFCDSSADHPIEPMTDVQLFQIRHKAADLRVPDPALWAQNGPGAAGADFLSPLLTSLVEGMGADCAYVGVLTTKDAITVRTVGVASGGKTAGDFEYPLAGSPCEKVAGKATSIYPRAVQREFPESSFLREMNAESYAGAPLLDCRGRSLGLLAVLSGRPLIDTQLAKSLLDVYASRVAAEIERRLAEDALYESERRYQALFESAGDAILLMNSTHLVDCNPRALQLFGCTREQLLGKLRFAFSPPRQPDGSDSREAGLRRIDQALRGDVVPFDWRFQRPDGSVFEADITLACVNDMETPHILAHIRDVTRIRQAERDTRESEARFRGIFGSAGVAMSVMDLQGRFIESNPAWQKMLGYSEAEPRGRHFAEFTYPEDLAIEGHLFTELAQGKRETYRIEKRFFHKSGRIVWGIRTATLVRSPGGEPQYVLNVVEDITDRKRAEAARRESEESFQAMIKAIPDGVYVVADSGRILEVNEAACKPLGYSREQLLQLRLFDIVAPRFAEEAARRMREKFSGTFETAHIRADGTELPLEINICPLIFQGHAARLGIARDITQRKRAEKEHAGFEQPVPAQMTP